MKNTSLQQKYEPTQKAEQTHQHILSKALFMATSKSLNDVTIGELAKAAGLSKSGIYAHFGSKENLQIAIIKYASDIFVIKVIRKVGDYLPPLERLKLLTSEWLNWYQGSASKCIFNSAIIEFDERPGLVRDAIHHQINRWIDYLEQVVQLSIDDGSIKTNASSQQIVFELYSLYLGSQKYYWLGIESNQRSLFKNGLERLLGQYTL